MQRKNFLKLLGSLFLSPSICYLLPGCKGKTEEKSILPDTGKKELDAAQVKKFALPVSLIPVLTKDTATHTGYDYYEVSAAQQEHDFGLRDQNGNVFIDSSTGKALTTITWGYNGIYLGYTIEARSTLPENSIKGNPVRVKFTNNLKDSGDILLTKHLLPIDPTLCGTDKNEPEIRIVPHLHGGHSEPGFDGHPEHWFTNNPLAAANGKGGAAGNSATFDYANDQHACTLWYHDHALGITRLNVYAGLAAFYIIRDDYEDSLNLPKNEFDIPLVIQDKSFYTDGSLKYTTKNMMDSSGKTVPSIEPEFFGDMILVNGKAWPFLEVEPRIYRFRFLNGSDSRYYNLYMDDGTAMIQIGAEGGFLPAPVSLGNSQANALALGNAERADVIIDFSALAGKTITLLNNDQTSYPIGKQVDAESMGKIMQFKVTKALTSPDTSSIPVTLKPITALAAPAIPRILTLEELQDEYKRMKPLLNGLKFHDPVTETPKLNDVEDWVILNITAKKHPIHMHLVFFQVIEKGIFSNYKPANASTGATAEVLLTPDPALLKENEKGWKDTVNIPPFKYAKIRAKFDKIGVFMWHCHILSHEDHEMMRPFQVIQ